MKITKVSVSRKFNLGNYESLDMSMESEVNEVENPNEILQILRDNIEMEAITMKNKKATVEASTQSPFRPVQIQKPKVTVQGDTSLQGEVCPICGGKKKSGFKVCYNCHEREKAE